MSTDRETTRLVRSWLEDGVTALPDRVLDAVLDQIPATRQRRSSWAAWRFAEVNPYARIALAAAAVLVVVVVGQSLLGGRGGVGGTPTAVPTVAPTPTTGATSTAPAPPAFGPIIPGTYAWSWPGGQLTFDMPAGWTSLESGLGIAKNADTPAEVGLANWLPGSGYEVTHVYGDACNSKGALKPVGPAVADLVAALDAQLSTDATVSNASLEGAKRVDLVPIAGLDRASCRHGAAGPLQIWSDPGETSFFAFAPDKVGFAYIAGVGGARLVVAGISGSDASAADIAELNAIVDSFEIQP